ncbi:hypothetical protein [Methylobacterium symbioticum]|uniref:Uncharacterized protein n=1 Tax=Methylobacterium symbioticum TaxID=2584084 RepID=A0A509ECG5_9HYPH|nr:hypothetical protein [Methylobacterium symbioticum]VUD71850.1 hypothetical protein MET9862_02439 [Methylobacterium symbioticum]
MSPATTARLLAGLDVRRGRPTAAQWVEALAVLATAKRRPGHWLEVAFTPGGAAQITEQPLPELRTA